MSKKIMLLALGAVSALMLAVPAMASASGVPVHINPKPASPTTITGGTAVLSTVKGNTVTCQEVHGTANWESTTTGTLNLTFRKECVGQIGETKAGCGEIKVTNAPFHLVTVGGKPGVLVTPPAGGVFATFVCGFILHFEVKGNGVIGTITSPTCGNSATTATIKFEGAAGVQKHKKIDGTETIYNLTSNGEEAAQNATGTVTFPSSTKLECT